MKLHSIRAALGPAFFLCVAVAIASLLFCLDAFAGVQQTVQNQANEILALLTAEVKLGVVGTIFLVRMIRARYPLYPPYGLATNVIVSGLVGAGCAYFLAGADTIREIAGASFATFLGSIIVYEVSKWFLGLVYQKTKSRIALAGYYFLTPKWIKVKNGKGYERVEPPDSLTRIMEWRDD